MRIALIILALAAVAVGMVHLRRAETKANHEIHRLQLQQIGLRRTLYDQQAALGCLTAPRQVRQRAERMDAHLTDELPAGSVVAQRREPWPAPSPPVRGRRR
ncbi:MAG TPA: hypothetical protein VM695_12840 [Phycisphaerae bacterium]|nr:hypothetical protein [Phycisphaerae bacterium]